MASPLAEPLTLKCGLTLKNRLAKAAMAECMADKSGLPNQLHDSIYEQWGTGGWGMALTGNVQVDAAYLGDSRDVSVNPALEKKETLARWRTWATACSQDNTASIMQINHPGRQSPVNSGNRCPSVKTIAPSAVPLDLGSGLIARAARAAVFGTPREMTQADIDTVVQQFVDCSRLSVEAGFQGVQIHAAHGYLLAQFLSARANRRTDGYGGTAAARAKIVVDIARAIREAVPGGFCVGIKLNSVDHQSAKELEECVEQLKLIIEAGVDFVEISGGTYEDPRMFNGNPVGKSARTASREAFFLEFARAIRSEFRSTPLMVTGGFRTRHGMVRAIEEDACDLIGIGRPSVIEPALPSKIILNEKVPDGEARLVTQSVPPSWVVKALDLPIIGSGAESQWYSQQIQKLGRAGVTATA